jgi:hypothetical protein
MILGSFNDQFRTAHGKSQQQATPETIPKRIFCRERPAAERCEPAKPKDLRAHQAAAPASIC